MTKPGLARTIWNRILKRSTFHPLGERHALQETQESSPVEKDEFIKDPALLTNRTGTHFLVDAVNESVGVYEFDNEIGVFVRQATLETLATKINGVKVIESQSGHIIVSLLIARYNKGQYSHFTEVFAYDPATKISKSVLVKEQGVEFTTMFNEIMVDENHMVFIPVRKSIDDIEIHQFDLQTFSRHNVYEIELENGGAQGGAWIPHLIHDPKLGPLLHFVDPHGRTFVYTFLNRE